jgi:hypothetical protein
MAVAANTIVIGGQGTYATPNIIQLGNPSSTKFGIGYNSINLGTYDKTSKIISPLIFNELPKIKSGLTPSVVNDVTTKGYVDGIIFDGGDTSKSVVIGEVDTSEGEIPEDDTCINIRGNPLPTKTGYNILIGIGTRLRDTAPEHNTIIGFSSTVISDTTNRGKVGGNVLIGKGVHSKGPDNTVMGTGLTASTSGDSGSTKGKNVLIGTNSYNYGSIGVCIGNSVNCEYDNAVAIGNSCTVKGDYGVIVGRGNSDANGVAVGRNVSALKDCIAIGTNATNNPLDNITSTVGADKSMAIGYYASCANVRSIAIGSGYYPGTGSTYRRLSAMGANSINIGSVTENSDEYKVSGTGSIGIGNNNIVVGNNSVVIGNNNKNSIESDIVIIGSNIENTDEKAVIIGNSDTIHIQLGPIKITTNGTNKIVFSTGQYSYGMALTPV